MPITGKTVNKYTMKNQLLKLNKLSKKSTIRGIFLIEEEHAELELTPSKEGTIILDQKDLNIPLIGFQESWIKIREALELTDLSIKAFRKKIKVNNIEYKYSGKFKVYPKSKVLELKKIDTIPEGWITMKQAIQITGYSDSTIRKRIYANKIESKRFGKKKIYPLDKIEKIKKKK